MPTSVFVWTPNDVVTLVVLAACALAMVAMVIAATVDTIRRKIRKLWGAK